MKRLLSAIVLLILASPEARAQSALSQQNNSVSVTTGLTYQTIAALNNGRVLLEIQNNNTNTDNCWVNADGAVAAGNTTASSVTNSLGVTVTAAQASILLLPGQSYTRYYRYVPAAAIVGTCATAGDGLYVGIH